MDILNSLIYMLGAMAPYILLGFLVAGLMQAFLPQRLMSRHLAGTGLGAVTKAAAVGVPLPLCSCGVLPAAVAMRRRGASRAASTSFLLATPQTGVDSIAATWSLLGPAFAVVRPVAALVTAVFGGLAVGRGEEVQAVEITDEDEVKPSFGRRCLYALRYGFVDLVSSIGLWLVVGLIVAALITVYVPADSLAFLGRYPVLGMLGVLVVAVPMYVCATGSIPVAMSLIMKGLSPGTALVMLMAGPAVNFASYAIVAREMGRRAARAYLGSIILGALAFGLAVDYLLPAGWFTLPSAAHAAHGMHGMGTFEIICAAVLALLLAVALVRRFYKGHHHTITEMTKTYNVKGMNCPHCQATVKRSIEAVPGVTSVDVDLSTGVATVEGSQADEAVAEAVRQAGFDIA